MKKNALYSGLLACMILAIAGFQGECQVAAAGARSGSMAGLTSVLEDAWSSLNNPAGLAKNEQISLATSLEQRFLMNELGRYALAMTVPAGSGSFAFAASYSGYKSFLDQKVVFSYGRMFGENFQAGLSLVYILQKAGNEGRSVHQVSYQAGAIISLSKKVRMGFCAFNPFQYSYKSRKYATLPSIYKLGLSYQYSSAFIIYTEIDKSMDLPPVCRLATELLFSETVRIRGGISAFPFEYSFGLALQYRRYMLEFASSYRQKLGFSPCLSFQIDIK